MGELGKKDVPAPEQPKLLQDAVRAESPKLLQNQDHEEAKN